MKLRIPIVLAAVGVVATLVLALVVVRVLVRTGGANAVQDNAALIGALVALGGVFTAQIVGIALEYQRAQETQKIEEQRAEKERHLEQQRAREAALQRYFEHVGGLLIEKPVLRANPGDNLSTVVRAQTQAVLQGLDANRKRMLLQFLYESGLIRKAKPVVSLYFADLRWIWMPDAVLIGADLRGADLGGAKMHGAYLLHADLREANLSDANLTKTVLEGADLRGAILSKANLNNAFLRQANLDGAVAITNEELERQTYALEGAIMPNGQKYEEWLKSRGEHEENTGRY